MNKHKLIYQIYPTSFGTLQDITDKIPLIAKLNPDYIWLNPIFISPWIDGGYDVKDYTHIDPRFGNMSDFRKLVATAKKYNIGILLDLVINHTSEDHIWFQKSRRGDPWYKDYYVWLDKPLNWHSFFGGPAFDYDAVRGQYYLHLYDRSQPDLNFNNPRVVKEFKNIINFWIEHGVAGFRVDSANVLTEKKLKNGFMPILEGFFNYYQTERTVQILEKLLDNRKIFTIAEPVGGAFFSKHNQRVLTKKAFSASFNIGTLDIADTFFSDKIHPLPVNYPRWFKKLASWSKEPSFSLALENHDTPRAVSRFEAKAKPLAMLQFLLPSNYPCIYQGQELGTANAKLSNNIDDYPGVQSRMMYKRLVDYGKTKQQAIKIVRHNSRDNARQPMDWVEYIQQDKYPASTLNFYRKLIKLWREDPVLVNGKIRVKKTSRDGVFDFYRIYDGHKYYVHIDLKGKTTSYLKNDAGETLISGR